MAAISTIIMAGGMGTRMRSPLPKVLHELCGLPMLAWVARAAREAGVNGVPSFFLDGYGLYSGAQPAETMAAALRKGHEILRQRAAEVTEIDGKLAKLADDMLVTMYDEPGAGLSRQDKARLATLLRRIADEGILARYGDPIPAEARERLEFELGVIEEMGFSSYFLIVWDFVRYAKENGDRVDTATAHERNRALAARRVNRYLKRIQYGNATGMLARHSRIDKAAVCQPLAASPANGARPSSAATASPSASEAAPSSTSYACASAARWATASASNASSASSATSSANSPRPWKSAVRIPWSPKLPSTAPSAA